MISSTVYDRAEGIVVRPVQDGLMIHDPRADAAVVLNASAARVWEAALAATSSDEVVDRVAEIYGVDAEVVRKEVEATVRRLVRDGLLRRCER